jgi:Pup amidohydrolase
VLDRLVGLETEYAIRWSPQGGGAHPGNDVIYGAIADAVRRFVTTHPSERGEDAIRAQMFTQNGGALNYEVYPHALRGGLLEASTPECRGPSQLLLYQKAQEALLLEALPIAQEKLHAAGFCGELGLLKNCRDAENHVYGAQENYEVEIARGPILWLYRLGLALLAPLIPLELIVFWAVYVLVFSAILFVWLTSRFIGALFPQLRDRISLAAIFDEGSRGERKLGVAVLWIEVLAQTPLLAPFTTLLMLFAFRRIRRRALAFIVSRPILTGTGSVERDGRFSLSEKGPAMRRVVRTFIDPDNRPIIDTGNLMKSMMSVIFLKTTPFKRLFARRQRLQLGMSDSNVAQVAEYLKIGTTALVVDMIEAGLLDDAPRLKDPIAALHAIAADPTLKARVPVRGGEISALELQRFYFSRAQAFVASAPVASIEAREIVRLWGEALDALEHDLGSLVGRLDWVTKRFLVEEAGGNLDGAAQKKIDLRYHELGSGHLAEMERRGIAPALVAPDEVRRAIEVPPEETPARVRGRLIRELAGSRDKVTVSWDSIRIGGRIRGQIIRLEDYLR